MRRTGLFAAILMVVVSCTQDRSDNSVEPTTTSIEATTTTGAPEIDPFYLLEGQGYDLDVFRDGLIAGERGVVDELFPLIPLYEADLTVLPDLTGLDGTLSVRYVNAEKAELDEVLFRLFPNISDGSTTISALEVDEVAVTPVYALQDSVMTVPLESPLLPGDSVVIGMDLEVRVPTEQGGKYGTFLLDEEILALAHALPLLAVYDDEGWNTEIPPPNGDSVYSDAGFFLVRLTMPADLPAATSGRQVSVQRNADGNETRVYAAGPARDFYIAASNRYEIIHSRFGETVVNSFAPAESRERSQRILDIALSSLDVFGDLYGIYPYTELDLVSTATLALGVEYPGVIAMALGHYDSEQGFDDVTVISTAVHEVAHQWFYGLVGNDQLDEPWLDEAMAQYATWKYWEATQGEGGAAGFEAHLDSRWARVDHADIPVGLPVAAYQGDEYGAIVYGRGPLEIGGLADFMGEEGLDAFLSAYAHQYRYGIATSRDFQALGEALCGCDLSDRFNAAVYPR